MIKSIFVCLMIISIALAPVKCRMDFISGHLNDGDELLYSNILMATGVPGGFVANTMGYSGEKTICQIAVLDLTVDLSGGGTTLISGGLGQTDATFRFQTFGPGNGYHFEIKIYGQ